MKKIKEDNDSYKEEQLRLIDLINQAIMELKDHRQLKSQKSNPIQSVNYSQQKKNPGQSTPRASVNPQTLIAAVHVSQAHRNPMATQSFSTPTKISKPVHSPRNKEGKQS